MVEIKKFYITESGEECYHKPFLFDCLNPPKVALLFFLEREYGEHLVVPDYLESSFIKDIQTSHNESRYYLNSIEGYLAVKLG